MPRRTVTLADPQRRRVGDFVLETRAFHLAQARKRQDDAVGLTRRYHTQMRRLRRECEYHARQAADISDIAEALR